MLSYPNPDAFQTFNDVGVDNGVSTITLSADPKEVHCLDWMEASFDIAPSAAVALTVTIGGTLRFTTHIADANGHFFHFGDGEKGGLHGNMNEALVITLAASGSSGRTGFLNTATR